MNRDRGNPTVGAFLGIILAACYLGAGTSPSPDVSYLRFLAVLAGIGQLLRALRRALDALD